MVLRILEKIVGSSHAKVMLHAIFAELENAVEREKLIHRVVMAVLVEMVTFAPFQVNS